MEAIKYNDRIFTTECNNCRALLNYKTTDIFYNNETVKVPYYNKNEFSDIKNVEYKDIKDTRPYVICPVCNNRHYI